MVENLKRELVRDFILRFSKIKDDEQYHDVWLIYTNHEEIPSVKCLLIFYSDFFKAKFDFDKNSNNQDLHPQLEYRQDIPLKIFKVLHDSIFTAGILDVVDLTLTENFGLLCLSNFYQFETAEKLMNEYFIDIMKPDNCWELLKLSAEYAQERLGNACGQFISQRITNLESNINLLGLDMDSLAFLLGRDTFVLQEKKIYEIALAWNGENAMEDITVIKRSIRILLATDEDMRQQLINWCGRNPNEYDCRPRNLDSTINITNLNYIS